MREGLLGDDDDDDDQATMGDQVSETDDFDSRYFNDGHGGTRQTSDNVAGESGADAPEPGLTDPAGQEPTSRPPGNARSDFEQPRFAFPDADATPNPPGGLTPSGRVPLPDHYWEPPSGAGRHGFDAPPPSEETTRVTGAPAPWQRPVTEGGYPPGTGRHAPQPPTRPAPHSNGPSVYGGPQQHQPPQSGYSSAGEQGYRPPQGGSAYPAPGGAPGHEPRKPEPYTYGPGSDSRQRFAAQGAEGERGVSVGDLRAKIRESQVAPAYKAVPQMGWRKGLYRATRINVGLSKEERDWIELDRRLRVDLRGNYVMAVMGGKGGVSKTTLTIALGLALKKYRDEKIVAIDANPASGNLASRIKEPSTMSWRGLISDPNLRQYRDFRVYMGKDTRLGLEVLGSDPGDDVLTGANLVTAWERLQVQYPIAIIDCGNQLRDDITKAILDHLPVDAIVVPSTTRLDGAKGAEFTLNWLMEHGYPHLVRQAVVVVSNINKVDASDQVRGLHEDFQKAVRAVHVVPFDEHLSDAVAIEFERLRPETQKVLIETAASLVDGFAGASDRESGAGGWVERRSQP